jgi:hypothetical protein
MALPTSGVLDLSDIQTEFGGSNPISLSEYYAGGLYVPSGTSGTNGAVPTSGEIEVSDFYGTQSGITITVTEGTDNIVAISGSNNAQIYGFYLRDYFPNSTNTGFNNRAYTALTGSRSPASIPGATIAGLFYSPNKWAQPRFYLVLQGTHSQSFVTSLNIQGYGTVATAAADGFGSGITGNGVTGTVWQWNITTTGWDGSGTRTVTIS